MDIAKLVADNLPSSLKFYAGLLLVSIAGLVMLALRMSSGAMGGAFGGYVRMLFLLSAFTVVMILMRFPEKISEVGGLDIEVILILLVGSFYGPTIGALFGGISTGVSQMTTANSPQYRIAETIHHAIMGGAAAFFVLTPSHFMMPFMIFLIILHVTGRAFCILTGSPATPQYLYGVVNIIWCYVIMRQFGPFLIGLF